MDNKYDLRKIKWRSRRGMRELDALCDRYLENHFEKAPDNEKDLYLSLLEMQDPELYSLLMHRAEYPSPEIKALVLKMNPDVLED
ncbi:succinate dehydrogenase assembly factor 2 [Ignatzschineria indica]|uniref:FAD assembly factor SdhE n=1 Tax=Ignatzschineria indica TaxID=472583 RepID=UPI0025773167|nr:succinate dehydrogenase assembly factor 2 [Ignatzschineria indica]MDM1545884.1 succinate dehydrogenase assembly factor 2 [Ignatzschineria indica]